MLLGAASCVLGLTYLHPPMTLDWAHSAMPTLSTLEAPSQTPWLSCFVDSLLFSRRDPAVARVTLLIRLMSHLLDDWAH